jgi:putative transposase
MKRSRFSEEQIIAILREQEAGAKTVEVCRKHGISDATFGKWKAKYGVLPFATSG